jgi:hypothetical protein
MTGSFHVQGQLSIETRLESQALAGCACQVSTFDAPFSMIGTTPRRSWCASKEVLLAHICPVTSPTPRWVTVRPRRPPRGGPGLSRSKISARWAAQSRPEPALPSRTAIRCESGGPPLRSPAAPWPWALGPLGRGAPPTSNQGPRGAPFFKTAASPPVLNGAAPAAAQGAQLTAFTTEKSSSRCLETQHQMHSPHGGSQAWLG